MQDYSKEKIRIGTLVGAREKTPEYINAIKHHGFESYSLTFGAVTTDIKWEELADRTKEALDGTGAIISTVSVYGNPLETTELDLETLKSWEQCIDNAHLFGADIVSGFTGRVRGKPIHDSLDRYKEIFTPLAKRAMDKGVRIAFENCDMGGTWRSGDYNIAHNPTAWSMMFYEVPFDNIGLEWEPCHQMVSLIDPMPQLREWAGKMFHLHGKDATIYWDNVRKYGVHSSVHEDVAIKRGVQPVPPFAYHRTPGFGDCNWTDIISELRRSGFTGCIDIEGWHDPVYSKELEMTGQVHSLNYLKNCRGGYFVENPNI
ncbi:MAG: sugar phosphate isomerase/epimerase [Lentisphaerae bacterium]|nr:sugar phosphate isomerase/epimerase [Lentisphaerota bacterium]